MTNPRLEIAYFCMEYGLHHSLPVYSGGLGVLAGDIVKAAHDQKRDFVAIGIFWSEGYTIQTIGDDGRTVDTYAPTTREFVEPTNIRVPVTIRGKAMEVTAYKVEAFGCCPLYLLEPVDPEDRWITKRLYGGDDEDRVAQEVLLGVAGVRFVQALKQRQGGETSTYHFNEGHALFGAFELIRQKMAIGADFESAWQDTKSEVVFTTHTPVPAGNEIHPIERLFRQGADLGCFTREMLAEIGGDPFEMTPAALRLSRAANGVAALHARTAANMWKHVDGAPKIIPITNGVHLPTWQSKTLSRATREGDKAALWNKHQTLKQTLIDEIEQRNGVRLREDALLVGFARRAATYKRAALIFTDLEWLEPLLKEGRLQIVFSGKAHPKDTEGKAVVEKLVAMSERYPSAVVFLENYEMRLGALLTRGCDIWLNNPRRPREASGTSGMKAAANGVLNVSILDGWWDEGCQHGVNGWQFGDGYQDEGADEHDLAAMQRIISDEVIPTYYDDRERWITMMFASISSAEELFSAKRMVNRYFDELY
jgi:starch phosphorylase